MARARHLRRTGPMVRLFAPSPGPAQRSWRDVHTHSLVLLSGWVHALRSDLAGLRVVQEEAATAAAMSERRATRLAEQLAEQLAAAQDDGAALRGELTALRSELTAQRGELTALRGELAAQRSDAAAVREELVWAFVERRHPSGEVTGAPAVRPVADAG